MSNFYPRGLVCDCPKAAAKQAKGSFYNWKQMENIQYKIKSFKIIKKKRLQDTHKKVIGKCSKLVNQYNQVFLSKIFSEE